MVVAALTGSRLRERRALLGLRQAEVARAAGISASYLNLIEHNRRRIGDDVLARLAEVLSVDPEALSQGAEGALAADLRDAAAGAGGVPPEVGRIEDFVARYPGWAELLAAQHRRLGRLERSVAVMSDRMTQDPHLSAALHELLSVVSAVRSTAAILADGEEIEPEWRARFHANLHDDAERLAVGAEALVAYLDAGGTAEEPGIAGPQEELESWLEARGWALPELERGAASDLLAEAGTLASGAAREMARGWIGQAARDAEAVPMAALVAAVADDVPDPLRLAQEFGAGVIAVFRRLALVPGAGWGVVICDASGTVTFRRPIEGFALPRFGAACPLWPLYAALQRPMSAISARVEIWGGGPRRFRALAYCQPHVPLGFQSAPMAEAAMLILPDEGGAGEALPIGTTCRICPRAACPARREPSILTEIAA
ncbi:MAG: XRE family transcriptional regulator [Cereibacter sphaeroides]|uniref:XRE family transcriptional regulator n=1 Tax=Cereibacter sphaeroides TaxID=1063 RepID=A0A2W5S241_CERSP|nr:MAG: XRE family transcriptional regulator [Cereibacter sphaeroides]